MHGGKMKHVPLSSLALWILSVACADEHHVAMQADLPVNAVAGAMPASAASPTTRAVQTMPEMARPTPDSAVQAAPGQAVAGAASPDPVASATPSASGEPIDRGLPPAGDPNAFNPYGDFKSDIYDDDALWICKPGLEKNHCFDDMVEAVEFLPDGSQAPFTDHLASTHAVDCVYWYPTVDRTEEPTSLDFSDPMPVLTPIRSQAARFARVCNVFAPFYRQASLNRGGDQELGYSDAVDSFKHYIANLSQGRDFIIIAHSQGTSHATRLIQQEIDNTPELRARMISALLIGGGVTVPENADVGGSFQNIPLCKDPSQVGCVVAYRAFAATNPPSMSRAAGGQISACTNPAALAGGAALLKGSFLATRIDSFFVYPVAGTGITAPWVLYRNYFEAECIRGDSDQYLEIRFGDDPEDMRERFLDLDSVAGSTLGLGLHVLDYHLALDDLVDLVGTQAAAKRAANP
jgi:hypothetical protein